MQDEFVVKDLRNIQQLSPVCDLHNRTWRGCTFEVTVHNTETDEAKTVQFCRAVTDDNGHMEVEQVLRGTDPWFQMLPTINALAPSNGQSPLE